MDERVTERLLDVLREMKDTIETLADMVDLDDTVIRYDIRRIGKKIDLLEEACSPS